MSKAKALHVIENTTLPQPKQYSKFRSFEDVDHHLATLKKISNQSSNEEIIEIDTNEIKIWNMKDFRIENERTKKAMNELTDRIKLNGQLVACFVKPLSTDPEFKYELIVGRRRFLAARNLGIKLKVIVKDVNDDEALIFQNDENERENPTDYERGYFYQKLIQSGRFTSQIEIANFFNKTKQEVSRALTYFKIPDELRIAIGDFDKVTSNTAEVIASLSMKSPAHLKAVLSIAEFIRAGKGHSTLRKMVETIVNDNFDKRTNFITRKVINAGRHLLTWKLDQNNNISISFPATVSDFLPQEKLEAAITDILNGHINERMSASGQKEKE